MAQRDLTPPRTLQGFQKWAIDNKRHITFKESLPFAGSLERFFLYAVQNGTPDIVNDLLRYDQGLLDRATCSITPHYQDLTALHLICAQLSGPTVFNPSPDEVMRLRAEENRRRAAAILKSLIDASSRGVDHYRDATGRTPLHFAALSGNDQLVKEQLEHGADPNAKNLRGSRPLHWACGVDDLHALRAGGKQYVNEQLPVISRLLEAGADLHAQNNLGNTALHVAVGEGAPPGIAEYLIKLGADPLSPNAEDKTALDLAREHGEDVESWAEIKLQTAHSLARQARGSAPVFPQMRAAQIFALDAFRLCLAVSDNNDYDASRDAQLKIQALKLADALLGQDRVERLLATAQSKGLGALITDAWGKDPEAQHEQLTEYFALRAIGEGRYIPDVQELDRQAAEQLKSLQERAAEDPALSWLPEARSFATQQGLAMQTEPPASRRRGM